MLGFNGDGLPARQSWLYWPSALALDEERLLIVDFNNMRIRRIADDHTLETIAGSGIHGYATPGVDALLSPIENPVDVAVAPDGSLYIAALHEARVLKVDPDGLLSVAAGTGRAGFSGDGGLAVDAELSTATGVAVGDDGSVYFSDSNNHCIRVIYPDGTIERVAGHGIAGFAGDGGPLDGALLYSPQRLVWDQGALLVADTGNHAIRRIDLDAGTIETVAGLGAGGDDGDGGPAIYASLNRPYGVATGPDGSIYIADTGNQRVRRITPDGTITPFAGLGLTGSGGDGGPALGASFQWPVDLVVTDSGDVFIADMNASTVRRVVP